MTAFDRAVAFVLREEGGLSEDPADPGGVTKFGISARAHPDLDIRELTAAEATAIYRLEFWDRFGLDRFSDWIAPAMLDTFVNVGSGLGPRLFQRSLNSLRGPVPDLLVDGILGPQTVAASSRAEPGALLVEFLAQRAEHYALLDGMDRRFGLGWYRRLLRLHALCLESKPFGRLWPHQSSP